jgi:hypothetical protein
VTPPTILPVLALAPVLGLVVIGNGVTLPPLEIVETPIVLPVEEVEVAALEAPEAPPPAPAPIFIPRADRN